jgi:energy-coupling factor transporter ATP-binding protein EcfA2
MAVLLERDKLPTLLQTMIKYPESRSHMLFLGPSGSGKTTTAQSFAVALHGRTTNKFASLLFLNSSDERSLETMRQKIYPFVESRMQSLFFEEGKAPTKVIIFDEAETLTDQAQCALRPLLHRSAEQVIIIFICNSLSHIHPQIINKFLIVPFAPTKSESLETILNVRVPKLDSLYRRGDIRFFKQCPSQTRAVTTFIFRFLHARSADELYDLVMDVGTPFRERITWFLLFNQTLGKAPTTQEISSWSSLTASETQPYLDIPTLKALLYKLWASRIAKLTPTLKID